MPLELTQFSLYLGIIFGLTYALFAAGFVLIYRSTGVLNFAQGEIGLFGLGLFVLFHMQYGVPYWLALIAAVALAALIGAVIELTVVRRLFNSPRLVLLIATVGVGQLLLFFRIALPNLSKGGQFPYPITGAWQLTDSVRMLPRDVLVLLVVPVMILVLAAFMTKTPFGLAVRASASNSDTARVYGISVKRTSTIVWTIAAAFAAISVILYAPLNGVSPGNAVAGGIEAMGPNLLLRALVVALIARMRSLPMTIVGGIAVGVFEQAVVTAGPDDRDIVNLYLFIAALVLVWFAGRGRREETGWTLAAQIKPIPERLRSLWYVRYLSVGGFAVLFAGLAILPVFLEKNSQLNTWTDILVFALVALSITPLAGWAGQLSLGQFGFVGLGALTMVLLRAGLDIPVPFDRWSMSLTLSWFPAVVVSTGVGVLAAILMGIPALRARGLYLTVITLAFAVMCSTWLFELDTWTGGSGSTLPNTAKPVIDWPLLPKIDFTNRRTMYYLLFVVLALTTLVVARMRRTGVGRSMIAVRDNEDMTAASTVSPARVKVMSFAVSGGIAALAGCMLITVRDGVQAGFVFTPEQSLIVVATAVIGGLGSIAGPILGALFVRGLPALFNDTEQVRLFTSSIGLLILLMYFPGGLMQIVYKLRDLFLDWADRRLGDREVEAPLPAVAKKVPVRVREVVVAEDEPWLVVRDVSVRFGGNQAVDHVSIDVHAGELVGLIGTNGAGKSTLMNAIGGFVPMQGTVQVMGRDVSSMPAYRRHRVGLGRGFQAARLFPSLTVRETVMVSLEARERSWLLPSMTGLPPSPASERRKRNEAQELVDFLGLGRYADEFVANLSTGTRRIVELATLLAVDARVLLLDEPTGGVAQREAEAFGPLIVRIQQELGAAMLVIEHDMPLIMSISDRVYCLEAGAVIAEGPPAVVRDDPRVIASYLGTNQAAIQRSGVVQAAT